MKEQDLNQVKLAQKLGVKMISEEELIELLGNKTIEQNVVKADDDKLPPQAEQTPKTDSVTQGSLF